MTTEIRRTSDRYLAVAGATCGLSRGGSVCGGALLIQDHGGRGEFRYELFCDRCKTCDPNGHRTLREALAAVEEYFRAEAVR